jgi:hypothetical protein
MGWGISGQGKRNVFKWICGSCHGDFTMKTNRLSSRCAPKCPMCGSLYIEPATEEAKDRISSGTLACQRISEDIKKKMEE